MSCSRGLLVLLLAGLFGLAAYVRLAPDDPARWHVALAEIAGEAEAVSPVIRQVPGGAVAFLPAADPAAALARLAEVAEASPRTRRLAGSLDEGRITWIARSQLIGFPDYISAETTDRGLRIWSRQRYGRGDLGVNLRRLTDWLGRM
ncbi:DUF1499 domain-containing protein [Tabrizicola oligotrophica]|uniref:DUF1499 domain-containing protein n=1 Tax=Tabrizicola oligotrophica TaxID=2710650 RepID=A0A6M0QPB8_9RHOB|nr:DUF1499 domain-containing protein [Tabrizicola oligotrophica]NEY89269.1 DUF1499 domain-containing protein [Tabrizicola oligotrophica]